MSESPAVDAALPAALYVVGTPIGNRADLSFRGADTLRRVRRICCEDTRHARGLLDPLGVTATLTAYHEHNEKELGERVADWVAAGEAIALITDAGMPGISDPGFRAVRACRARGLPVVAVPGPTAVTTALAVSGLPTDAWRFVGFLPAKSAARRRFLEAHREAEETLALYESTHRIEAFLEEMVEVLGPERCVCLARELTKHYETVLTGPVAEVRARLKAGSSKGEFVVLIAKAGYAL